MKKIAIIICFLLFSCSVYKDEKEPEINKEQLYNELYIQFSDKNIMLNYGSEFIPQYLVIDANGKVTFPEAIDTNVIGTHKIYYKVSNFEYPEVEKEYVVYVTVTDKVSEKYQDYVCNDNEYFYFKNLNEGSSISIVLNPDGNTPNVNLTIGSKSNDYLLYSGKFSLVEGNVYSFSDGQFSEDHISSSKKPNFGDKIDGYFKLEDNKLYFIANVLTIDEMQNYSSDVFCTLNK